MAAPRPPSSGDKPTSDGRPPSSSGGAAPRQTAPAVLMVRPAHFFVDPDTASTNSLQPAAAARADHVREARVEFDRLANALDFAGVRVCVQPAAPDRELPDAEFPNNWVSLHADGTAVLYPMLAPRRRLERDRAILTALQRDFGFAIRRTIDLSSLEERGEVVEGTGSLVLDHVQRLAYATLSPRTTEAGVEAACQAIGYRPVMFRAQHASGAAIYHTNVMLSIGTKVALGCFASIRDEGERARVVNSLSDSGREIVDVSESQMLAFAANCLELDADGQPLMAISQRAWDSLGFGQRRSIERGAAICAVAVDTIENIGGGGVRCMLAEISLPRR